MTKTYTKATLTREVLEKGVKLRVIDEEHSAAFQQACFDLDVFWADGDKIQHTSKPYIFVVADREKLKYANSWEFFMYQPETEIYFDDERVSTTTNTKYQKGYTFDDWWDDVERLLIATGQDDPHALAFLKSIANRAWDTACERVTQWIPEETTCYCGDIYSPDVNLNACIVIQETGYCPNCIAMEMRECKK